MSVVDALRNADRSTEFVRGETSKLTYRDLVRRIDRLTTLFATLGLRPGERVIVASSDDLAVATIYLGLLRNGLTTVILNPEARATELARLVDAADPSSIFADEAIIEKLLPEHRERWHLIRVKSAPKQSVALSRLFGKRSSDHADLCFPASVDGLAPTTPPGHIDPELVAYILFTSGTTSRPKGVEITHRALFAQMTTFARHYELDATARILNLLPLHHTDGLTHGVTMAACTGARLLRPLKIRVNRIGDILDACHDLHATHVVAVPSMLSLMLTLGEHYQDVFRSPHFRFVISTAAYLDETTWERFEQRFDVRVVNVYGLTETVCETMYCGPDDKSRRIGTVGKPIDAEARIVDDNGRDVPTGEAGELLIRGPHVMRGYFRMPAETDAVLKDGWFHTGDLATVDQDGFYRIVGRKKDVIISAGLNIYPEDVNAVLRSVPGIVDAATVAVPDEQWGERVASAVVVETGSELTEQSIAEYFLTHTSPEKLPREIHFLEELPRGPAGKVIKPELKRIIDERRERHREVTGNGSDSDRVLTLAARAFKQNASSLSLDATPDTTPGWTSLAHVEFLMSLEVDFKIDLSPEDIMRIGRLRDALSLVRERNAA